MNSDAALKKLQAVELEILEVINKFCLDNGIQYFIDGGTALGASTYAFFF